MHASKLFYRRIASCPISKPEVQAACRLTPSYCAAKDELAPHCTGSWSWELVRSMAALGQ